MKHRLARVNEVIKRELSDIISREITFGAQTLVTVHAVEVVALAANMRDWSNQLVSLLVQANQATAAADNAVPNAKPFSMARRDGASRGAGMAASRRWRSAAGAV